MEGYWSSETKTLFTLYGKKSREVILIAGQNYRIDPLNPGMKKNRGRVVTLLAFNVASCEARVRFVDTGRIAVLHAGYLVDASTVRFGSSPYSRSPNLIFPRFGGPPDKQHALLQRGIQT